MPKRIDPKSLLLLSLITACIAIPAPKAHAQVAAFVGVIRPLLPAITTWIAASDFATVAGSVGLGGFVFSKILSDPSGAIPTLQGQSVNSVDLYTSSPSTPAISVAIEPAVPPKDMPSTWKFDYGTGLTFDPLVNSPSGSQTNPVGKVWNYNAQFGNGVENVSGSTSSVCSQLISIGNAKYSYVGPFTCTSLNEATGFFNFCNYGGSSCNGVQLNCIDNCTSTSVPLPTVSTTNAPMWPSDGHCTVQRTGNTFSGHPQDPDCWLGGDRKNPPISMPPGISVGPSTITGNNGNGGSTTITINPDGSTTIGSRAPNAAGTGTTETIINLSPPVAGTMGSTYVTGQTQNIYQGTGTSTSSTPIPQTAPLAGAPGFVASPTTSNPATTTPPATPTDLCVAHPNIEACQVIAPGTPSPTDGLYTKQTGICQTFGCILDAFATKIKASQLWGSTVGFFRAGDAQASCGGLSTSFSLFGRTIDLNIDSLFCGATAAKVYTALSIVLLITVTVSAFTIAVL